ncbi:hypothetical protein DNJ72_07035 [Prochlorococcus marinus XMU1403]|nr:hypothetical protein [Prochlorococcus marinus str. MU1403]PYE00811.1 hypothetical protein DNJ72_07035 [Prochlorococcus marinus XMU1403]
MSLMRRKTIQWINTPVISEAIFRYEKGLLPNSMKLWLEQVLEIKSENSIQKSLTKYNQN